MTLVRRSSIVLVLLVGLPSYPGIAIDRIVPEEYATIQAAVDAAATQDTVLVLPGVYHEVVTIEGKTDLAVRGAVDFEFSSRSPCWDIVAEASLPVTIDGSIRVVSSSRITIEGLTVTGEGPGISVSGSSAGPSESISIRYCNLLCNKDSAIELTAPYRQVSVSCTNACLSEGQTTILGTEEGFPHQADVHITCSLRYDALSGPSRAFDAEPVIVAVIDSGIDRTIPALACRMWRNSDEVEGNGIDDDGNGYVDDVHGWDFRDEDADSMVGSAMHWHGTFVAGVLADAIEPETGPNSDHANVQIMDLRFLNSDALFYSSEWGKLVRAIEYAVENNAHVINLSIFATREPPQSVRDAVGRAVAAGILVVAAAGNGAARLGPIASWEEVLTVTALDREGDVAGFSDTGREVDVGALGVDVLSLLPGGELGVRSGTSFATPRVAGLAALHMSEKPDIPHDVLEAWLRSLEVDGEI